MLLQYRQKGLELLCGPAQKASVVTTVSASSKKGKKGTRKE